MSCEDGKHGALYCNFRGKWFCLVCGDEIDSIDVCRLKDNLSKLEETKEEEEK